ncbi:MAG: hypothetical protein AW09_004673 [Candidatus Accumulibacter phosphatis]|uniref:Uncharacterized protein n=1 Tax=Candidatus Accumulibacter phosphatis TaxID=327160 RepID=A0A084Y692_9PROT|nr:MAG: hypothetical protein AW09_004673 [Candidatus Accumulibacter phosphatis]
MHVEAEWPAGSGTLLLRTGCVVLRPAFLRGVFFAGTLTKVDRAGTPGSRRTGRSPCFLPSRGRVTRTGRALGKESPEVGNPVRRRNSDGVEERGCRAALMGFGARIQSSTV